MDLFIRQEAERDLDSIEEFIANDNPAAAVKFIERLTDRFVQLQPQFQDAHVQFLEIARSRAKEICANRLSERIASPLSAIFPLNSGTSLWLLSVGGCFGLGMAVDQRPEIRQILLPLGVVLAILGMIAGLMLNQNRANFVRLSTRGIRVRVLFAQFEIAWADIEDIFANAAMGTLDLKTTQGVFQLGTELSDFDKIAGIIEVNQARVKRGHITGA